MVSEGRGLKEKAICEDSGCYQIDTGSNVILGGDT